MLLLERGLIRGVLDGDITNGLVARYKRVVYRKYPPVIGKCILLEKVYIIFIRYIPSLDDKKDEHSF